MVCILISSIFATSKASPSENLVCVDAGSLDGEESVFSVCRIQVLLMPSADHVCSVTNEPMSRFKHGYLANGTRYVVYRFALY